MNTTRIVNRKTLGVLKFPQQTESWHPISHASVIDKLFAVNDEIKSEEHLLSRNDSRLLSILTLNTIVANRGVVVFVVHSTDKSKSYSSSLLVGTCQENGDNPVACRCLISCKQTLNGEKRFFDAIRKLPLYLEYFFSEELVWLQTLKSINCNKDTIDAILLRILERKIVSSRILPNIIKNVRKKLTNQCSFYDLYNTVTECISPMRESDTKKYRLSCLALHRFFTDEANSHRE